jgi:hypothetical protein
MSVTTEELDRFHDFASSLVSGPNPTSRGLNCLRHGACRIRRRPNMRRTLRPFRNRLTRWTRDACDRFPLLTPRSAVATA